MSLTLAEATARYAGHPSLARILPRCVEVGECWVFLGGKDKKGYGRVAHEGRIQPAHRITYTLLVGPVSEGLTLDHLCRVRACCNPACLEPVTNRENVLRGTGPTAVNAKKTHCIHGHEFTPENTHHYASMPGRGCKECRRAYNREYSRRKRLERQRSA